MLWRLGSLAAVAALSAGLDCALASRNSADDIVRGGAWLYHAEADPCGSDVDGPRTGCQFVTPKTPSRHLFIGQQGRPSAANVSSVSLSVYSEWIDQLDPLTVKIKFTNLTPAPKDWVAAYCIENETVAVADDQYLDFQYMSNAVNNASIAFGPLVNMRCSWQFRYFTNNGTDANIKLATSPYVRFRRGKTEPLHVRVAKTEKHTEMRVMWVSAPVDEPVVEYGLSPFMLNHRASASGDSYKASDMCQEPATRVTAGWFRDPGVIYNAVMTDLTPESTYYYRVCGGGSAPCSKTFKLKTPPAPGVQKGVASFFVYGDLGDWNIHATGPLPVK